MFNLISGIIIIVGFGAIGGFLGGLGFAYGFAKIFDKKLPEYIEKYKVK